MPPPRRARLLEARASTCFWSLPGLRTGGPSNTIIPPPFPFFPFPPPPGRWSTFHIFFLSCKPIYLAGISIFCPPPPPPPWTTKPRTPWVAYIYISLSISFWFHSKRRTHRKDRYFLSLSYSLRRGPCKLPAPTSQIGAKFFSCISGPWGWAKCGTEVGWGPSQCDDQAGQVWSWLFEDILCENFQDM